MSNFRDFENGGAVYGSWRTSSDSTSQTSLFTGMSANYNIPPKGISINVGTGRFTFDKAGVYMIAVALYLDGGNATTLSAAKNGASIYTASTYIHGSVDPVERSMTFVLDLAAGDYLTFASTIATITKVGSGFSATRIA